MAPESNGGTPSLQFGSSPAAVSRFTGQPGYFDTKPRKPVAAASPSTNVINPSFSPLSSASARHLPQTQSLLSPPDSQAAIGTSHGRRTSSLSPPAPRRDREIVPRQSLSAVTSPTSYPAAPLPDIAPGLLAAHSQPRSVSVDAASAPTSVQIIRRLTQQNGRIREAWEAERKYLEANRERVEEVYKEERVIMEEERTEWETEKAAMADEIHNLRQHLSGLQGDNVRLRTMVQRFELEKAGKVARHSISLPGPRSGGDGPADIELSGPPHIPVIAAPDMHCPPNGSRRADLSAHTSVAPFSRATTDGAAQPPVHSPGGTSISPSRQPEVSPFIPVDPNMQHISSPPIDFLASPKDEDVPIVDIQTIHPELDGIAIRVPAVHRETFTDSGTDDSKSSSQDMSPSDENGTALRKQTSKDQTLQVLAAPEPKRLTMHAGHTPNHSLSQLPTAAVTTTGTVAGESGGQTPTRPEPVVIPESPPAIIRQDINGRPIARIEDSVAFELEATSEDIPEPVPMLESTEDKALKGPLMVRNIPAHDEIFFKKLSEKLEDVSRGQDATPTCLQPAECDGKPIEVKKEKIEGGSNVVNDAVEGGRTADDDTSDSEAPADDSAEIPLKLKKTANFGAPLGTMF